MYGLNRLTYTRKRYALLRPTFCEIYQISDADLVAINAHNFGFLSKIACKITKKKWHVQINLDLSTENL